MITDTIGMKIKYPSMMDISKYHLARRMLTSHLVLFVIVLFTSLMRMRYMRNMNKQDVDEFIESMNTEQFAKVQQFFDTMPS